MLEKSIFELTECSRHLQKKHLPSLPMTVLAFHDFAYAKNKHKEKRLQKYSSGKRNFDTLIIEIPILFHTYFTYS